jgi:hypothetical protein
MSIQTLFLNAGQTLTVTADANSSGIVYRQPASAGGTRFAPVALGPSDTLVLGPFAQYRQYSIDSTAGEMTYAVTVEDLDTEDRDDFEGLATNMTTIPTDRTITESADEQLIVYGTFTIIGTFKIGGEVRFGAWPF